MSTTMTINRPSSPSSASSSSPHYPIYSRDELLTLAISPLSQSAAPSQILAFPQIMRKNRRGVIEAYQALEYARNDNGTPSLTLATRRERSPQRSVTRSSPSSSPRTVEAHLPTHFPASPPAPVWKVDVYVPPARRVEPEQRNRLGRDARTSRAWRRPVQARAIQMQGVRAL